MPTSLAIGIVLALAAVLLLDHLVRRWGTPLLLARASAALIRWLAFWRERHCP